MKRLHTHLSRRFPTRPLLRSSQHGMALIEVLVSLLIFAFGVLGLIGLESRAINFSVDAEDRNRAALLANEISSSMWLTGSVTVSTAALAAWNTQASTPTAAGLPNGVVTITPVAGSTNSTDIAITWTPPSHATVSTLTTRVILP
jgi:type IV pilus assembly protein PilV